MAEAPRRFFVRMSCGHVANFYEELEAAQDAVENGSHILCTPCRDSFSPFFKAMEVEEWPPVDKSALVV